MKNFDLNIKKVLEDWEVFHAIREIIANALDEQALTNTKEIEIFQDPKGCWLIFRHAGLPPTEYYKLSLAHSFNSLSALFLAWVLVFGDFVWNEDAVAFERVVDEITRRHTARREHKCLEAKHILRKLMTKSMRLLEEF